MGIAYIYGRRERFDTMDGGRLYTSDTSGTLAALWTTVYSVGAARRLDGGRLYTSGTWTIVYSRRNAPSVLLWALWAACVACVTVP